MTNALAVRADRRRIVRNLKARLSDGSVLIVVAALLALLARIAGS